MYFIVLAFMFTGLNAPALPTVPALMGEYVSLEKCKDELTLISKTQKGYKRVIHNTLGYSVVKFNGDDAQILFCVRDMRSV